MASNEGHRSSLDKDLDSKAEIEHTEVPFKRGQRAPQTPEQRNAALQAALLIDPGVGRFSWAAFQVRSAFSHSL